MANPQKEDGFTPIANEIMDALAISPVLISPYESKCLFFLLRKTYGWQKTEDKISLSQFSEGTGIKIPHVCRTLKKLVTKKIITQIGNGYHVRYSFQKNYEKWLPKQVILPKQVLPKQVMQILPKQGDTKETIQKKYTLSFLQECFEKFWGVYPRKCAKQKAMCAFTKLNPSKEVFNIIMSRLELFKKTDGWIKDGGQFIPHPATWINQRRWEDDIEVKNVEQFHAIVA